MKRSAMQLVPCRTLQVAKVSPAERMRPTYRGQMSPTVTESPPVGSTVKPYPTAVRKGGGNTTSPSWLDTTTKQLIYYENQTLQKIFPLFFTGSRHISPANTPASSPSAREPRLGLCFWKRRSLCCRGPWLDLASPARMQVHASIHPTQAEF